MKKNFSFAIVTLSFAVVFFGSTVIHQLYADEIAQTGTCSNATLKDSWGYYRTGTNNNVEVAGPYAGVGIMFADGNGNVKRRQTVSFNGSYEKNTASFQYEGTPTAQADCSTLAVLSLPGSLSWMEEKSFT